MRTILLLVTAIVSLAVQAYEPLIREDRIWEYFIYNKGDNYFLEKYQFDGIQEINGRTYHQFKHKTTIPWETKYTIDSEGNVVYYDDVSDAINIDKTVALIREENQKVYMYVEYPNLYVYDPESGFGFQDLPEDKEIVILDFSENEIGSKFFATGDQPGFDNYIRFFEGWPITQYEVLSVVEDSDSQRNIHTLKNIPVYDFVNRGSEPDIEKANVRIAEGIGNIGRGTFFMPQTELRIFITGSSYHGELYSYIEDYFNNLYDLDGNILFKGLDKHPDTSGIGNIEISVEKEGKMYDLFGRELRPDAQLAPGTIYIRDGKKQIAR